VLLELSNLPEYAYEHNMAEPANAQTINKGAIDKKSHNSTASSCLKLLYIPTNMLNLEIHG
jgi:hypothetical protein